MEVMMAAFLVSSKAAAKRKIELREKLWPGVTNEHLWDRKNRDGFATIPRTLPLMLTIMNDLADSGKPVGPVYLELWSRLRDEGFLSLNSPQEMAFASGHTGQRAMYTWRDRISKLRDLGFLDVKPGPFGPLSYALFWNPYHVIRKHYEHGKVREDKWQALVFRANEIGADDLDEDVLPVGTPKASPKKKSKSLKKPASKTASVTLDLPV
jgi:hypothetical protein